MAETIVELLTDVADAIREKTGSNEPINAQSFADEIKNLPSGGDNGLADAIVTRTITEYVNNEITEIGAYAFYGCNKLTKLESKNLNIFGIAAFQNCSSLKLVLLPNVEYGANNAFKSCSALEYICFEKIQSIGASTFQECSLLQRVDLGRCIYFVANAFNKCTSLTTLIIRTSSLCSLNSISALADTPIANGTGYVYVPDELVDTYKEATNWATFASQIKGLSELPNE